MKAKTYASHITIIVMAWLTASCCLTSCTGLDNTPVDSYLDKESSTTQERAPYVRNMAYTRNSATTSYKYAHSPTSVSYATETPNLPPVCSTTNGATIMPE